MRKVGARSIVAVVSMRGVAERFRLLGWSAVLMLLSIPAAVAAITVTITGLSMLLIVIGIPMAVAGVWLTRRVTDLHRLVFAQALDVRIPRPYRPWPSGSLPRQLLALIREPATWRDMWWLLVNATLGCAAYSLVVSLFAAVFWYGLKPLLWAILTGAGGPDLAESVLRVDFGFWAIDSQAKAFLGLPLAAGFLLLWWWLTPPVLRRYARLSAAMLGPGTSTLAARVQELTESRAETVDSAAAELRRIERDLHDGAQARLVSLGMSLGMAEELLRSDPDGAAQLLAEARADSGHALAELRNLVRGIHPPVLSDRGLVGAVQALALAHPLPVQVTDRLSGRPPAPVESAAYFATAEVLTNVAKHAGASAAQVRLGYGQGRLRVTVSDDGSGGAVLSSGGGLRGVQRRLSAFDGTVEVASPAGGPTIVTMEIPCELSSAKTTPSSATG